MISRRLSLLAIAGFVGGSSLLAMEAVGLFRAERADQGDAPAAQFERTEYDFGVVESGDVLRFVFPVRNSGARRLVLTPSGCRSCTEAETVMVSAGGSAEIVVTLETAGLTGDVRHVARYTSSDPQQPRVDLVVTARVIEPE